MSNEATKIYAVGAKVSLGDSGAFTVVEQLVVPFAKGTYDGRPCAEGERPTHYSLRNHRTDPQLVAIDAVVREVVSADRARAILASLRRGAADATQPVESLDALAKLGFVVPNPPPRGARAYDVNDLRLAIEDNARILRAYYALDEAAFARGPAAWITSFERVVLGELALALDVSFESLRDELHAAHAGVAAYDAGASQRAADRKAVMEREKKRKKKPLPLP